MPSFQTRADDGSGGGSGSSPSRFLSASTSSPRKSPSKQSQSISRNRSSGSLRGASLAQSMDDDTSNSRFSLAHELAAALMPEPSASSKLLAEEFGIEYDEGAEGIDGDDVGAPESESFHEPGASLAQELDAHSFGHDPATALDSPPADDTLDPTFGEPTPIPRSPRRSEQDAMAVLSNDLETTDKLLADLRRLDAESSSQPALERLALDWIRRIDDTVRDREGQVRELLEYEREFRKISAEVGGSDALAVLPTLEDSSTLIDEDSTTAARSGTQRLQAVQEDGQEWDAERTRRGEEEDEDEDAERDPYGEDPQDTPVKDSFTLPPPPPIAGPLTPGKTIPQLTHLRTSTTSLVSSLVVLSEHAQVNGAATTEAGRKIRALKNKLGGWRTDWDSAERSRLKIERWEEENSGAGRRMDGRRFVEEHLRAFELALSEANVKTQAIMAAS